MRKRLGQLLVWMFLFLLPAQIGIFAAQKGDVYDEAELLTEEEIDALNEQITSFKEKSNWNVYAVTTENAQGKTVMAYAEDFFDEYSPEVEDGIVALIDMDNREICISTCGEARRYLTDERLNAILEDAYNEVAEANYAKCMSVMLEGVATYYEKGIPSGQYNYDTQTGEISVYHAITPVEIVLAVLIAIGVFAVVFGCIVGKYRLKFGTYHYEFRKFSQMDLKDSRDVLVNSVVTHRRIPKDTGSSGGASSSGRSSVHTSSSGRSHGGASKKF